MDVRRLIAKTTPRVAVEHPVLATALTLATLITVGGGIYALDRFAGAAWSVASVALLLILILVLRDVATQQAAIDERQKLREEWARERERMEASAREDRQLALTAAEERSTTFQERTQAAELLADQCQRVLRELTAHHLTPFQEELTVRYFIGDVPDNDRIERSHKTHASDEPGLLWRTFEDSATGKFEPMTFAAAAVETWVQVPEIHLEVTPLSEQPNRLRGLVTFSRPIGLEPVNWGLRYRWPGMWNDMRRCLWDEGAFTPNPNLRHVEVHWIFEHGWLPHWNSTPPKQGEALIQREEDGRWALIWRMEAPPHKTYAFTFGMKRSS